MRLVSVIVPTYNPQEHLLSCLASVFSQTYTAYEVIVVDDGSEAEYAPLFSEVMMRFPCLRLLAVSPNRGVAHARNLGAAAAHGEYLAFLDHDDLWDSRKLELQTQFLDSAPDCGYVTSRQRYFLSDGMESPPKWVRDRQMGIGLPGMLPGTLMVRASVFAQVGDFDESLRAGTDDVDWFFRANTEAIRGHELPEELLLKRIHGRNLSAQVQANNKELLSVIRMNIARRKSSASKLRK